MRPLCMAALLLWLARLGAAEIRNGQLFLETLVAEGKKIILTTSSQFEYLEADGFYRSPQVVSESFAQDSLQAEGEIHPRMTCYLELAEGESEFAWGILNRTEQVGDENLSDLEDMNLRKTLGWENGRLDVKKEKLIFENKYFSNRAEAENYAKETGYPLKQIIAIPMQNARMKFTDLTGKIKYINLPARLFFPGSVRFNDLDLTSHEGAFTVKAIDNKLVVTNLVSMDYYLSHVLPYEIGPEAPYEALRAQAVAARSHSISLMLMNRHTDDGYDVCSGTHCQVYKPGQPVSVNIIAAVDSTNNEVMVYGERIADGVYHSNCGGWTESNQNAWNGTAIPYLQGVACNAEADTVNLSDEPAAHNWVNQVRATTAMASWERKSENWDRTVSRSQLEANTGVSNLKSLQVLKRGASGRILKLKLSGSKDIVLEGEYQIRRAFGGLPSSFFIISNGTRKGGATYQLLPEITVKGRGAGHGVGMCQVGALQKAREGWSYRQILEYYYPGVSLNSTWLRSDFTAEPSE